MQEDPNPTPWTLDKLIARLEELRAAVGGDVEVVTQGCDCIGVIDGVERDKHGLLITRSN